MAAPADKSLEDLKGKWVLVETLFYFMSPFLLFPFTTLIKLILSIHQSWVYIGKNGNNYKELHLTKSNELHPLLVPCALQIFHCTDRQGCLLWLTL